MAAVTSGASAPRVSGRSRGRTRWGRTVILVVAGCYFILPVLAAFWFSVHNSVRGFSLHAYTSFIHLAGFTPAFRTSLMLAVATVLITLVLMLPTMIFVQLRAPWARGWVETFSLLPLVIPPVALAAGVSYVIRLSTSDALYGTVFWRALNALQSPQPWLLALEYVVMALPFTYRALDAGLRSIPVPTLVEAARNLGAGWASVVLRVLLPSLRTAVLNAALLTFALVLGEYTLAKILAFTTFPVWLVQFGGQDGQLQVGLSLLSLLITWILLIGIAVLAGRRISLRRKGTR
ncbi:ABC transporter permease subunit [Jatrophihabitans telluris]|uniref:ABC transporter permease subunit n=1 Tax=Jatrophihabitans telluris TaxID=2038343 RepID=A0ABY4R0A9_9ACTN|nr:ABC transporter permease subunit [Jatrophihabitans telluris]UQX88590.1 ABC transporter permease subunit [Jatrophihabitans telluris]